MHPSRPVHPTAAPPESSLLPVFLTHAGRARELAAALEESGTPVTLVAGGSSPVGLPPLTRLEVESGQLAATRRSLRELLEERPDLLPRFGTELVGEDYQLRPSAYVLLRDPEGRLALARQPLGDFLIGGGIEPGESAEEAVLREAVEEVGLRLEVGDYLGCAEELLLSPRYGVPFQKRCHFFGARILGTAPAVEDDHQLVWEPPQQLLRGLFHQAHRWAVALFELGAGRAC